MSTTRVVNLCREPYTVYIGRENKRLHLGQSIWGNPFRIGPDGSRDEVIRKYSDWLDTQDDLLVLVDSLAGETLGCYCAPLPCHGDVLLRIIDGGRHE